MSEAWSARLTTQCTCENYNEDTDDYQPSDYCHGDCWEWAWNDASELIEDWAKRWDTNGIRVEGVGMTWQKLSGYAEITFSEPEEALKLFTIDGDFTLEVSIDDDGQLSVRRFSHDEPMGCSMVGLPISEWG
jgi:hypothetical protein